MRGMLGRGVPAAVPGVPDPLPVLKSSAPQDALRMQPCSPAGMGLCLWAKCCAQSMVPKRRVMGEVSPHTPLQWPHPSWPLGVAGLGSHVPISSTGHQGRMLGKCCAGLALREMPGCSVLGGFTGVRVVCLVHSGCGTDRMALPQSGHAPCVSSFCRACRSPPRDCVSLETL